MLIMLVIVSLSVVGAILMFYKYTLSKTQVRYILGSGLLTKHEVSMKLSRIQIMVQAQDWLDVLLICRQMK
jgi:putative membrane protein